MHYRIKELVIETPVAAVEVIQETPNYNNDILLVKSNTLELKLYSHLFDDLGFDYKAFPNTKDLISELNSKHYKVILFDKESIDSELKQLHDIIADQSVKTSLVMLIDPSADIDPIDRDLVDEIIKNVMNKDLLRLIIEKFI